MDEDEVVPLVVYVVRAPGKGEGRRRISRHIRRAAIFLRIIGVGSAGFVIAAGVVFGPELGDVGGPGFIRHAAPKSGSLRRR
jgi:hypothetical protein